MLVWTYIDEQTTWAALAWRGYYEVKIGGRVQLIQAGEDPISVIDLGMCTEETVGECKRRCEVHHRDALLSTARESAPEIKSLAWTTSQSGIVHQAIGHQGLYELTIGGRVRYAWPIGQQLDFFDLGECTEANLDFCKRVCDEHNRTIMANKIKGRGSTM